MSDSYRNSTIDNFTAASSLEDEKQLFDRILESVKDTELVSAYAGSIDYQD